jgi:hypothetical protein
MVSRINPLEVVLDAFQPTFDVFLSFENVSKGFLVKNDGFVTDVVEGLD